MRRISFSMTEPQFLDGSKTVTRRLGWRGLKAGDRLLACDKCMGIPKGGHARILGEIEVVDVRREPLDAITEDDVAREGFPGRSPRWFVGMYVKAMRCYVDAEVTRIEFRQVKHGGPGDPQGGEHE